MKKIAIVGVAIAVIVIIIVGGYAAWANSNQAPEPTPTPTPTPTPLPVQEQIRDECMEYIKTNHPETAELMMNLNWTGGRQEPQGVGAETYMYTSEGWQFILYYPVVPDPEYTVTGVYSPLVAGGKTVNWVGTYKSGNITEASYEYT